MAHKDSLEEPGEEDRIVTGPPARTDGRPAARSAGEAGPQPTADAVPSEAAAEPSPDPPASEPASAEEPGVVEVAERIAAALAEESAGAELAGETPLPTTVSPMIAEPEAQSAPEESAPEEPAPEEPAPEEGPVAEPPPPVEGAAAEEPELPHGDDWLVDRIDRAAASHAATEPVAIEPAPPPVTPAVSPPEPPPSEPPQSFEPAGYVPPPPFEPRPPARADSPPSPVSTPDPHDAPSPVEPPQPSAPPRAFVYEPIRPFRPERREEPAPDLSSVRPGAEAAAVPLLDVPVGRTKPAPNRCARVWSLLVTALRYTLYAIGCYLAFVVFLILLYRVVNPPISNLMLIRLLSGTGITRTWVPLSEISPELVRAVIVSEDGRFCEHYGIDLGAIREAIQRSGSGIPRGASTISMQVTKNLFLWPSKSYVRKLVELPLTLAVEFVWPKSRIMEVYLNIAEWGPGIFGAEAAAQYHFGKPASRLGEREAALLAASLPNPVTRDAGDPGPRTSRKARIVQGRMRAGDEPFTCVLKP